MSVCGEAVRMRRRGSSKLCTRLNFVDQSDGLEMINFNFIHDSGHCKEAAYVSDQPGENV